MATNPLFKATNSPTKTTRPTKAVNEAPTHVRLTHNTFDNSYFNFKTQRYGQYEPFWWKYCVPGDVEPFSNSHNVRSLPFASAVLSPMKLNKDYFQVPMYAIQPNAWDYIYKTPTQGDDVPLDSQNIFPLFSSQSERNIFALFDDTMAKILDDVLNSSDSYADITPGAFLTFLMYENFLSSGSLLYQMGYKLNPLFQEPEVPGTYFSYDEIFDQLVDNAEIFVSLRLMDPDAASGSRLVSFATSDYHGPADHTVDRFTIISLIRSHFGDIDNLLVSSSVGIWYNRVDDSINIRDTFDGSTGVDYIRMDAINAYQLACAQYYVNPRVDFIYNAQLYRDNFVQLVRELVTLQPNGVLNIEAFDYNGIPVLYDYFSIRYYRWIVDRLTLDTNFDAWDEFFPVVLALGRVIYYLFGFCEQLRFGDYLADSRPQALGYGEPGSDVVQVMDQAVSVTDLTQSLVLQRFRGAVAHLDNSAEDYLETMFHEQLPPDYHYPKFIVHSEFGVDGSEVSNTTSDDQGNIVTNLKSGSDSAEFNIDISVPCVLIGISYISVPTVYCQIKERHYMHLDRYDMFQPMLQYFGDQGIYNREVSDRLPNPGESYGYTSRNGEYKQRLSQCSGAFTNSLRSWLFTVDLPEFAKSGVMPRLALTQSPLAIRTFDFEFNRFFARQSGISLGTGFHFIMQYNNKNVDNRPMDVNPLPLYPSQTL